MTGAEQVRTGDRELRSAAAEITSTTSRQREQDAQARDNHLQTLLAIERTRMEEMRARDENQFRNTQDFRDRLLSMVSASQRSNIQAPVHVTAKSVLVRREDSSLEANIVVDNFQE